MTAKMLRKIVFPSPLLGWARAFCSLASRKEMLTIADKPLNHCGVEEALAAGMDEIILVAGCGKGAIEGHFDISAELEMNLRQAGKEARHKISSRILRMVDVLPMRARNKRGGLVLPLPYRI